MNRKNRKLALAVFSAAWWPGSGAISASAAIALTGRNEYVVTDPSDISVLSILLGLLGLALLLSLSIALICWLRPRVCSCLRESRLRVEEKRAARSDQQEKLPEKPKGVLEFTI